MSQLLNQLRFLADGCFADHAALLEPMGWRRRTDLENLGWVYGSMVLVADHLFCRRLSVHAFWCGWNLVLDPPKSIDSDATARLELLALSQRSPFDPAAAVLAGVRHGLDRLQAKGYPSKPLRPVRPGHRDPRL